MEGERCVAPSWGGEGEVGGELPTRWAGPGGDVGGGGWGPGAGVGPPGPT